MSKSYYSHRKHRSHIDFYANVTPSFNEQQPTRHYRDGGNSDGYHNDVMRYTGDSDEDNLDVSSVKSKYYNVVNTLKCIRYTGTFLSIMYLFVKLCYLGNSIIQLFLMQYFLGFTDGSNSFFGLVVLHNILHGHDWQSTLFFPRVAYCYAPVKNFGTKANIATAQCVLPTNMLNEKIYIFLWWWILLVSILNASSLLRWFLQFACQNRGSRFIIKYIKLSNNLPLNDVYCAEKFARKFLRRDGMFVLRMLASNAGEMITSEIINAMWVNYRNTVVQSKLGSSQQLSQIVHHNDDMPKDTFPSNVSEARWNREQAEEHPPKVLTENTYSTKTPKTKSPVFDDTKPENRRGSIEMANQPRRLYYV
ncbi:unnamed protein product [Trichobilharzia szidati]|nr:unnamed protein product [Trichobilharzia szidati]